jgi:hypothetical protein
MPRLLPGFGPQKERSYDGAERAKKSLPMGSMFLSTSIVCGHVSEGRRAMRRATHPRLDAVCAAGRGGLRALVDDEHVVAAEACERAL